MMANNFLTTTIIRPIVCNTRREGEYPIIIITLQVHCIKTIRNAYSETKDLLIGIDGFVDTSVFVDRY